MSICTAQRPCCVSCQQGLELACLRSRTFLLLACEKHQPTIRSLDPTLIRLSKAIELANRLHPHIEAWLWSFPRISNPRGTNRHHSNNQTPSTPISNSLFLLRASVSTRKI